MNALCKRVTFFVLILLKKIKGTSVYYVNGPETLPPPLSAEQEEDAFALPPGLENKDILAVHMGAETIAVNLSGAFARAVSALSHRYERAAVYAMVNTLTEESRISRVVFFFDGAQSESLAGGLEMRGAFVRNPGMVVN